MNEQENHKDKKIYLLLAVAIVTLIIGMVGIIATISLNGSKQTDSSQGKAAQLAPGDGEQSSATPLDGSSGNISSPKK